MKIFLTISTFEGGAEISSDKLADLLPDSLHFSFAAEEFPHVNKFKNTRFLRNLKELVGLYETVDQPHNILIVTHRQVKDIVERIRSARIVCICRGMPIENEEVRSFDGGKLARAGWPSIIEGMNHRRIAAVVAPSEAVATQLKSHGLARPVTVIGNLVDIPPSLSTTEFKVHLWSRHVPWKHHRDIYRAISVLSDIPFVICSDQYLGPRQSNVQHRGWINDPWKLGQLGDLVMSMSRHEAFGRDAFEAMARGCLVGCFEGTPIAEHVRRFDAGSVFDPGVDISDVCEAIRKWSTFSNADRTKRTIPAGEHVRIEFSGMRIAASWSQVISGLPSDD
jgi:hypothetical protein